jgi:hypothetical protein
MSRIGGCSALRKGWECIGFTGGHYDLDLHGNGVVIIGDLDECIYRRIESSINNRLQGHDPSQVLSFVFVRPYLRSPLHYITPLPHPHSSFPTTTSLPHPSGITGSSIMSPSLFYKFHKMTPCFLASPPISKKKNQSQNPCSLCRKHLLVVYMNVLRSKQHTQDVYVPCILAAKTSLVSLLCPLLPVPARITKAIRSSAMALGILKLQIVRRSGLLLSSSVPRKTTPRGSLCASDLREPNWKLQDNMSFLPDAC